MTRLIIPGYLGSPAGHWQAEWLKDDPDARLVAQASWERPHLADWLDRLATVVRQSPNSVLVAHSLGCILVAHLARFWPDAPVAGALLVAPADVDLIAESYPVFASFAPIPGARLPFASTLVASRNDRYAGFQRARQLASQWGSTFVDLGNAGHINIESGFGRWPAGYVLAESPGAASLHAVA